MTFNPQAVLDVIASHAEASGRFEQVNTHEPKNAPKNGLHCAIWADRLDLVTTSGLASSSARAIFKIRIYKNMVSEPQDAIDPDILTATTVLYAAYNGDFELGGEARNIDLLGTHGEPLFTEAGYLDVSGRIFRVMDTSLPVIFNDAFDQAP